LFWRLFWQPLFQPRHWERHSSIRGALRESGAPVNGTRNITFRVFDASSGGAQVGSDIAMTGVVVADGLFSVSLDFGTGVFQGDARWLEIQVGASVLTPRQELTPVPYALFAANAGASAPSDRIVSTSGNTLAVVSDTGRFLVSGAIANSVSADYAAAVGGFDNAVIGGNAAVLGGLSHIASGGNSAIVGGNDNTASGDSAAILGGLSHIASGGNSAIVGGNDNTASGSESAVVGGLGQTAQGNNAAILGGNLNSAAGAQSAVTGGLDNHVLATGTNSAILGGIMNSVSGAQSVALGGVGNDATGNNSAVLGGLNNEAVGSASATVGGENNAAQADHSLAAGQNADIASSATNTFLWSDGTSITAATPNTFIVQASGGAGVGTAAPNEELEVAGRVAIRDPGNNGALILSPSTTGYGVDPELVIQSAELNSGDTAPFHISRNAIFQTSDDTYQYIDDVGDTASKIEFENDGDIKFSYAPAGTGTIAFTNVMLIDGDVARVGIGTTTPTAKLHIGGTAGTDGIRFPDGTLQTTAAAGDNLGNHTATTTLNLNGQVLSDTTGTNVLTLQDANGIDLDVSGTTSSAGLRVESATVRFVTPSTPQFAPNVIGGIAQNFVTAGVGGAVIGGGGNDILGANSVTEDYGTVGGGYNNTAGDSNLANFDGIYATVGGGANNTASQTGATVGGGVSNTASGLSGATVGGGQSNTASGINSTVGGGESNTASGQFYPTVGGGQGNTANGLNGATVGGGFGNTASGLNSPTVSGGQSNTASAFESPTVSGGESNTASGDYSTVPGGLSNTAGGEYSFAAGRRAKANNSGSFVWGDSNDADVSSNGDNTWTVRASGGARFLSNSAGTTGVNLASGGGSWTSLSDRAAKENIVPINGR
jgi:hypothetical protein